MPVQCCELVACVSHLLPLLSMSHMARKMHGSMRKVVAALARMEEEGPLSPSCSSMPAPESMRMVGV